MRVNLFCLFLLLANLTGFSQPAAIPVSAATADLFQTIRQGDDARLATLLKAGADPNSVMSGYSALMAAALNGTPDAMKILLKHGAHVNYANADSISALWLAIPDMEKTNLLLQNGANVNQRSLDGNTVIIKLAAMPGTASVFDALVKAGCSPSNASKTNDGLYNAAGSGDTALVARFLRAGALVNDTNCFGDFPINAALNYRCFSTMSMLVDHGANTNPVQEHAILPLIAGTTPLMWAALSNDQASFDYLLSHGANPKALSPGGYTVLTFLARSAWDNPVMTKTLLDKGVSPTAKAHDDTDALYHFKQRGNTASLDVIKKYAANQ